MLTLTNALLLVGLLYIAAECGVWLTGKVWNLFIY